MSEPHHGAPAPADLAATDRGCPGVAELIQYALGQVGAEERQRIDAHQAECGSCRSWIAKAAQYRSEPIPAAAPAGLCSAIVTVRRAPPRSPNDSTPIPESRKWQRQAFDELQRRLLRLDEEI